MPGKAQCASTTVLDASTAKHMGLARGATLLADGA
jgi:hypothetical protein